MWPFFEWNDVKKERKKKKNKKTFFIHSEIIVESEELERSFTVTLSFRYNNYLPHWRDKFTETENRSCSQQSVLTVAEQ